MAKTIDDPRNARSRRTKDALLTAARTLIEEQGFEAVTMGSVAAQAGITRRGAYLHYDNRTDLLLDLLQSLGETEDLGVSLQRVWNAPDAVAALDEWAHHIARAHPRILAIAQAVEEVRRTDPGAAAMRDEVMRRWRLGCRRLASWLDDEGRLSPDWNIDAAADMIWALMSWDVLEALTIERGWSQLKYADRMSLLLRATFVAD